MKITNCYTTSIVNYEIETEEHGTIQYKEYMEGHKVTDEELFDQNGGPIFDDELLDKVRALVNAYPKED